ncbi:TIGR02206 family membrane protein [Candidatus Xianfuyuplasma coldseepsis]|uniref:TIGR02206 family membrane protein n=1 Tax=Candidatus Xianfuyuplasma coldseepsis TaxID=2782163 RepID=A0A7L7KR37_9MOLU|nr:TIGR02206 family membrane protein [Xianfuyuplasma coldseepsis]QMS85290.1 TIGR02206 family membrane protein [Xianfuyuplasma coldseepsis]
MSFERFWSHELNYDMALDIFTWQHVLLITLGVLSVVLTLHYAPKIKASNKEPIFKKIMVGILIFLELIYHIHYWSYGLFSVPLHVCSFGAMFSIALLLTNRKSIFDFVFFIGVFGGLAALFVPNSLGYTYYNMRYYHYILIHMMIVIVPVYYYKAYNYRVTLKSVYKPIIMLLVLSPLIIYTNVTFDRNYMFVGEKPRVLASVLPDWPYYVGVLFVMMFVSFHILYYVSNHLSIKRIRQLLHV